jgi:hypothetical protein
VKPRVRLATLASFVMAGLAGQAVVAAAPTGMWADIATQNSPTSDGPGIAVGGKLFAWGGATAAGDWWPGGFTYDPTTDSWSPVGNSGGPGARANFVIETDGSRVFIWGGMKEQWNNVDDGGFVYDTSSGSWTPMSAIGAPSPRAFAGSAWTGNELIVYGGGGWIGPWAAGGARYQPATNSWTAVSSMGAPRSEIFSDPIYAAESS